MRLLSFALGLAQLLALSLASPNTSNALFPPLFSPPPFSSPLPFLHTSLSTLLPVVPHLAPPPEYTLLVTLATPAFKPLLYNWLCFLRYKAHWGEPASHDIHGEKVELKEDGWWEDVPKLLVITSDEGLARELSDEGVVVWWLRSVDWDAIEDVDEDDESATAELDKLLRDDLFGNLRLLDLLLPPEPSESLNNRLTDQIIPWGTLHYQSLMLERTLAMSALVGALVESQKSDPRWRKERDDEWRKKVLEHDWENEGPLEMPEWVGVRGVLLVDNDAVWLSSPTPFLSHYYRPTGSHPSIIYSPDMAPSTRNAWGTHTMPCACFFYSRVSDYGSQLAAPPSPSSPAGATSSSAVPPPEETDPYLYSPAEGAAEAWRTTAICHIAMLLESLEAGRQQAFMQRMRATQQQDPLERESIDPQLTLSKPFSSSPSSSDESTATGDTMRGLKKALAPSFQATSLGPALFLSEQLDSHLLTLTHTSFLSALGSGEIEDLLSLLDSSGLSYSPSSLLSGKPKTTCLSLAQSYQTTCPAPPHDPPTSLTLLASLLPSPPTPFSPLPVRPHRPIRTEPLPFDLFPPGMRFFDGGLEPGARPCVVHANYATGGRKEELLRRRGLWALTREEGREGERRWTCSAEVMQKA
ncbi:hypothetical protein JCM8547_006947 [Rhodosporidiobolus lusitaniae]